MLADAEGVLIFTFHFEVFGMIQTRENRNRNGNGHAVVCVTDLLSTTAVN